MGFFDLFKKKGADIPSSTGPASVASPTKGIIVPMSDIPDAAFNEGAMGFCCGIESVDGVIVSPLEGNVMQVADSYHALGVAGKNGVQVVLHVGVDTVNLKGEGFTCHVRQGDMVKQGQPLLTVDLDTIRRAGYPSVVIIAVINSDEFSSVKLAASGKTDPGAELIALER